MVLLPKSCRLSTSTYENGRSGITQPSALITQLSGHPERKNGEMNLYHLIVVPQGRVVVGGGFSGYKIPHSGVSKPVCFEVFHLLNKKDRHWTQFNKIWFSIGMKRPKTMEDSKHVFFKCPKFPTWSISRRVVNARASDKFWDRQTGRQWTDFNKVLFSTKNPTYKLLGNGFTRKIQKYLNTRWFYDRFLNLKIKFEVGRIVF